jgi:hypothetical protein
VRTRCVYTYVSVCVCIRPVGVCGCRRGFCVILTHNAVCGDNTATGRGGITLKWNSLFHRAGSNNDNNNNNK